MQEDHEFEDSLGYIYLKNKTQIFKKNYNKIYTWYEWWVPFHEMETY